MGPGSVDRSWDSCYCDLEASAFSQRGHSVQPSPKPGRASFSCGTLMPFRLGQRPLMAFLVSSWTEGAQGEC